MPNQNGIDLGEFTGPALLLDSTLDDKGQAYEDLIWRQDPEDSFSDWKILITLSSGKDTEADDSDDSVATYHVHRNILARGTRKSEYFERLFKINLNTEEHTHGASKIDLTVPSAAASFPLMLDFLYGKNVFDDSAKPSIETVVALRHLSTYFGIRALYKLTAEYIKLNMMEDDSFEYLMQARLYQDEKLITAAAFEYAKKLSKSTDYFKRDDTGSYIIHHYDLEEEINSLDPDSFECVMESLSDLIQSEFYSFILMKYLQGLPAGQPFPEPKFCKLTCCKNMPHTLDLRASIFLLNYASRFDASFDEDRCTCGKDRRSLETRCTDSFRSCLYALDDNIRSELSKVPLSLQVKFLHVGMEAAQLDRESMDSKHLILTRSHTNLKKEHKKAKAMVQRVQNDCNHHQQEKVKFQQRIQELEIIAGEEVEGSRRQEAVVSGANDLVGANGIYIQTGQNTFKKGKIFGGRKIVYTITRKTIPGHYSGACWVIGEMKNVKKHLHFAAKRGVCQSKETCIFYFQPANNDLPPSTGWRKCTATRNSFCDVAVKINTDM